MNILIVIKLVLKNKSLNISSNKYKLEKVEVKNRNSLSLKKINRKKKVKLKQQFKSEEIDNKIHLDKNKRMSLNKKEDFHHSINIRFKSLNERDIIMKNTDLFSRDFKIRMKNKEIKNGIKMKIDKYQKIFNLVDRNNTGILSTKNLNLSLLSNEQLELLTPFLIELQKKRRDMNFKEFCILIDRDLTSKFSYDN